MDEQISRAKEEASSRKVIMEKVERWMLARDEERWLEEYSTVSKPQPRSYTFTGSKVYCFFFMTKCFSYVIQICRMRIDTQLVEEPTGIYAGLKKPVLLSTNYQVN